MNDVKMCAEMNLITPVYSENRFFQKVDVLCGINIKKVACGTQFSVALTKDGRVFTFGQGRLLSSPVRAATVECDVQPARVMCTHIREKGNQRQSLICTSVSLH